MKTAAAYIRVSTEDQIEFSPDSQLKEIRKYAKAHDMILPEEYIFVDEGISGRKADKRPAFQRMIGTAKIKPTPFETILLWKFSRFARNREDSIVYKSMLRKQCGIDVVSISEPLGEDKTSVLLEAVIEAMDEFYSLNLSEEVRRGMSEKFSRGGVVSPPPFGYKKGDGVFVPDETNAPIVQMIFKDYIGGMTVRQIAQKLNNMGVKTIHGNSFGNRNVEYIISNPVYIGQFRRRKDPKNRKSRFYDDNTETVKGKHEPIISEEDFETARKMREKTKKLYTRYARSSPAQFMLRGLVRCDNCGATLVCSAEKKYLQCHNYSRGQCAVSHSISIAKINDLVLDKIKEDLDNPDFDIHFKPSEPDDNANATVQAMIKKEEVKLLRVKEAYEAGIDTIEEYKENKLKIQTKINELKKSITKPPKISKANIKNKIRANLEILQKETVSETIKNTILRSFVDKIIFFKPKSIVEIIYKI
jgi:DNA invertase Pin-like site-specific DNA recombinase/flagellar basal body rod protein FlgC